MNCVRCGTELEPGQAQCACGQYVDLPSSEFYARVESQVERSSRDSFRRGLLIGLGFLLAFLILETIMDTIFISLGRIIFAALTAAVATTAFNVWQWIQKRKGETSDN